MKTCTKCGIEKPLTDFYRDNRPNRKTPYMGSCKTCKSSQTQDYYSENPDKRRDVLLRCKYGISLVEWDAIFESQGQCCAICKRTDPGSVGKWHSDHNHETGQFRGILCLDCNVVLGKIENGWNVEVPAITQYLELQKERIHAV